jgi:transcriptional regulator with XRE-family HTH domain
MLNFTISKFLIGGDIVDGFKNRIKFLRNREGYTLKELGEKLGYSESTIFMYEKGDREPKKSEDYIKIANFFNVTLDFLMGRAKNENGMVVNDNIEGNDIEIEVDKEVYPNGLTHDEVLTVLEKLKELGVDWEVFKKK